MQKVARAFQARVRAVLRTIHFVAALLLIAACGCTQRAEHALPDASSTRRRSRCAAASSTRRATLADQGVALTRSQPDSPWADASHSCSARSGCRKHELPEAPRAARREASGRSRHSIMLRARRQFLLRLRPAARRRSQSRGRRTLAAGREPDTGHARRRRISGSTSTCMTGIVALQLGRSRTTASRGSTSVLSAATSKGRSLPSGRRAAQPRLRPTRSEAVRRGPYMARACAHVRGSDGSRRSTPTR